MAIMLPGEVDPADLDHESEAPVYAALRDQLGNDYVVLHSYPWLRPDRDQVLAEGEADFLVVHRTKGLLVLEVKGGDVRHERGRWVRQTAAGPKSIKDPFEQARRNMHALVDIIKDRAGNPPLKGKFTYGYAVVFPHLDYTGSPPNNADAAIIISQRHLPMMEQAIETAFAGWPQRAPGLTPAEFQTLLNACLLPKFRLYRPIGPDITKTADRLLELTETQAQVFEGLYAEDRVLVEGVAGSGKTLLALHRALAFARDGRRTLLVCYNKALAEWLRAQVDDDPSTASFRDALSIRHFHGLARELADAAGLPFAPASGGPRTDHFWNHEARELLGEAMLTLDMEQRATYFDAIVVDEAQDFFESWWYALTQDLLTTPSGPLYAFIDPNQSLRGEVHWPNVEFNSRFKLTINCRNTRKIAAASASVLDLATRPFLRAPAGGAPRVLRASSSTHQKGLVLQELRTLLQREGLSPSQIAVIGPAAMENGSLKGASDVDGTPLVASPEEWRRGAGILVTTARTFKGLEADVVLLYDLGGFGPLFKKEDLYVACTRAKVHLIAVVHGEQCRQVIDGAVAASEAQQ